MSRVLFLTKRRYMGKDLIGDRYGRFREVPLSLARAGDGVRGIAFDYSGVRSSRHLDQAPGASVGWDSVGLGRTVVPGVVRHARLVRRTVERWSPDVIVGASDAFHVIRAVRVGERMDLPTVVDLYDNFESYRGTTLPGIFRSFVTSVRRASVVTCVTEALAQHVRTRYERSGPTVVIGNGVRTDIFRPGDKASARSTMRLDPASRIVVMAGALRRSRDVEVVFEAIDRLALTSADLTLVVAGPRDPGMRWPSTARVVDLGVLEHSAVAHLLQAADVAVVPNRDSDFGRFCHPQKALEAMAVGVPVVAASVPAVASVMVGTPERLYRPGDPEDAARAISTALTAPAQQAVDAPDWQQVGDAFAEAVAASMRA